MLRPDPVGERADEALYGMAASVTGEENGMLKVRTRYRYEGYVSPDLVSREYPAEEWEKSVSRLIIAPAADVMAEPSYESHVLTTLPRGALLVAGEAECDEKCAETDWLRATLADGKRGYVRRPSVRPVRTWADPEYALRANIAADAKLYLGAQYRWGGKSHFGIDCSGLVSMAYMLNGLYIYRDARIIEGFPVKEIPEERAKLADLLFWDGHVALYIGERRYIHSTGRSSGVVVNSLDPSQPDYREDLSSVKKWGSVF
jgi:prepilin-type processing-associated H-X9-DG protein